MSALPADATRPSELRFDLVFPVTRVGFGAFSIDPLAKLIGAPVQRILEPLIVGEVRRELGRTGNLVERFPLSIPDGEGLSVPLGSFGSFGARNDRGTLVLTVPSPLVGWISPRFGADLIDGPVHRPSDDGGVLVADLWVRLRAGMRLTLPLGALGEGWIEAGC